MASPTLIESFYAALCDWLGTHKVGQTNVMLRNIHAHALSTRIKGQEKD